MNTYRALIAGIDCLITEPDDASTSTSTLVCLHGIGGDEASFTAQSVGLSNQYRVIACNLPGYGQSPPIANFSFEALSTHLLQLIDALPVTSVHIMGQSIGGMIAQDAAHRFPERITDGSIASLILIATTTAFGGKDHSFKTAFLNARLKPLDNGLSMQQIADAAIPSIVGRHASPEVVNSAIQSMANLDAAVYRDVLGCLVTFNRRAEWPTLTCPVCLISGDEDTNAPASTMEKMATKLPHAEYHNIENAGHLVNLEQGDVFNEHVRRFLHRIQ